MMKRGLLFGVLASTLGCGAAPPAQTGTGAREATLDFFEALAHKDFERAYAGLSTQSKSRLRRAQFDVRAKEYCRNVAFQPRSTKVSACDEIGAEAIGHVVLIGNTRRYKDAVVLRREEAGWRIVLSPGFGVKVARPG